MLLLHVEGACPNNRGARCTNDRIALSMRFGRQQRIIVFELQHVAIEYFN